MKRGISTSPKREKVIIPGPSEKETQRAILDYLAATQTFALRMNSGSLRNPAGRPVTFGLPGMADILAIPLRMQTIEVWWIEVKDAKGKQSELQKAFQVRVEAEGHGYILARSLDDVLAVLG